MNLTVAERLQQCGAALDSLRSVTTSSANGDMYSVTFETMGNVPATQASQTVDELFRLAKEAVQRQLVGTTLQPVAPTAGVTIPQPVVNQVEAAPTSPQVASIAGNGRLSAVPGTAQAGKLQIKDPTLPATSRQIGLLKRLARQKGKRFDDLTDLTMGEASAKIDELMALCDTKHTHVGSGPRGSPLGVRAREGRCDDR